MITTLMIIVFVLGYMAIVLEHPLKIDKAASALIIGGLCWALFAFGVFDIIGNDSPKFLEFLEIFRIEEPIRYSEWISSLNYHEFKLHFLENHVLPSKTTLKASLSRKIYSKCL